MSLEGLSIGDAFGQSFFHCEVRQAVRERRIADVVWNYTDDTVMAISIVETLIQNGQIHQDDLAQRFAKRYADEPDRGYGGTAHAILRAIGEGMPWRDAAGAAFGGMGSMGNGAAMRAGPIGAYFAHDLDAVVTNARLSAEVTHTHREGQAGAIAVAVAAAVATRLANPTVSRTSANSAKSADDESELLQQCGAKSIFDACIERTPPSETRERLILASEIDLDYNASTAARALGNGMFVTSQDTVPFSIWCALRHLNDFEEALWTTVSGDGDMDTTCAIVGSIVAVQVGLGGLPVEWRQRREALPELTKGDVA